MAVAAEHPAPGVHVHETPHELRVEIELPEGEPHLTLALRPRVLEVRVLRHAPEPGWHANPNAAPT